MTQDEREGGAQLGPEHYRALYDHSPDGVLFTVPDGRVLAANPAACEILGRSEAEICALGRQGTWDTSDDRWEAMLEERARTGRTNGIARMIRGDGSAIEVEVSVQVFIADGEPRTCTILRDVTERVRMERELAELRTRLEAEAVTDELTGLHNRRGFIATARHVLEIARREGAHVALMFVDIDRLKEHNDRHGHEFGDRAICAVAEALSSELREADTIARIGGDEFAALALGVDDRELESVEHRIRERLTHTERPDGVSIDVSIGWSVRRPDGDTTIEQLLEGADRAMYREKAVKRGHEPGSVGGGPDS